MERKTAASRKPTHMGRKELKFESGLMPAPLAKMTDCYDTVEPRVSLTDRRLTQGLFIFALVCTLGVGQLYLQFSIQEMKTQQREMQVVHRQLVQEAHLIRQENSLLTDPSKLREFASNHLRMKETDPRTQKVITVPSKLAAKYAIDPEKPSSHNLGVAAEPISRSDDGIIGKILTAIFESDSAYARDKGR